MYFLVTISIVVRLTSDKNGTRLLSAMPEGRRPKKRHALYARLCLRLLFLPSLHSGTASGAKRGRPKYRKLRYGNHEPNRNNLISHLLSAAGWRAVKGNVQGVKNSTLDGCHKESNN